MNDLNEHDDDVLAGEYVLGTLQGDERREFEQRLQRDETLRARVNAWEGRLDPMLNAVEPVTPPAALWDAIDDRINPVAKEEPAGFWNSLVFWRNFGLATATLLVAFTLQVLQPTQGPVSADRMMVVLNAQSQAGWVVAAHQQNSLKVQAIKPTPLPHGQVCQLWMQTPDNQMVSVGVLPHTGVEILTSPMSIPDDAKYKVSIETMEELPADKPTGKIVFEGELISI